MLIDPRRLLSTFALTLALLLGACAADEGTVGEDEPAGDTGAADDSQGPGADGTSGARDAGPAPSGDGAALDAQRMDAGMVGAGDGGTDDTTDPSGFESVTCTPGEPQTVVVGGGPVDQCHDGATYESVPNWDITFIWGAHLPEPTVAGEPYTFAFGMGHSGGPGSVEIWGSDAPCGRARELLYWTDVIVPGVCASFVSAQSHDELLIVMRNLEAGSISFNPGPFTFCGPEGSCQGPTSGHALMPNGALDPPPLGAYDAVFGSSQRSATRDVFLSAAGPGRMILVLADNPRRGETQPIAHGVFRAPLADPFGDAWYCTGAGATYEELSEDADGDDQGTDLALRELTRLSCAGGDGALSIDFDGTRADVSTTLAGLSHAYDTDHRPRCWERWCWHRYQPSADLDVWLFWVAEQSVGRSGAPINTPTAIVDAVLVAAPTDGSALQIACATGGSITYDADVATTVELSGVSALGGCPGEPIDESSADFHLAGR